MQIVYKYIFSLLKDYLDDVVVLLKVWPHGKTHATAVSGLNKAPMDTISKLSEIIRMC